MFATTSDELARFFRAEVSDDESPYLWQDWEVYGYMTEGFDALLKEANVVDKVMALQGAPGQYVLPLPASVTHIHTASMHAVDAPQDVWRLSQSSHTPGGFLINGDYGARTTSAFTVTVPRSGRPQTYMRDYDKRALRLDAALDRAFVVDIQCSATLSMPLQAGAPLPSTDAEDLRLVLHYMKFQAYQKHDAETEDLVRANSHGQQFRQGVVERESKLRNYRRPAGVIRMGVF